jgi:hypothetical protein
VILVSMHFLFVVQVMVSCPGPVALLFVILMLVLRSGSFLERVLQILVCSLLLSFFFFLIVFLFFLLA